MVGLRSRLTPPLYPPIKVVRAVLGKLAGRLPLVVFHVEITSARQGKDVICEGRRGRPLLFLCSVIIRSAVHQRWLLSLLTAVGLIRPVGTVILVVTPQVGLDTAAIVTHQICDYRTNTWLHHI